MDIYHALIERSGPNDVHDRLSIEAASLTEARHLLEERYGKGKVACLYSERESSRPRQQSTGS